MHGVHTRRVGRSELQPHFEASGGTVMLETRDPEGGAGTDRITLTIEPNAAPDVVITAPAESGVYYADSLITFSGTVSDAEDDVDGLTVTWETAALDVLDVDDVTADGHIEAGLLDEGEHGAPAASTPRDATGRLRGDPGGPQLSAHLQHLRPARRHGRRTRRHRGVHRRRRRRGRARVLAHRHVDQ